MPKKLYVKGNIECHVQGEPNEYWITNSNGPWIGAIKLNGEIFNEAQEELMVAITDAAEKFFREAENRIHTERPE